MKAVCDFRSGFFGGGFIATIDEDIGTGGGEDLCHVFSESLGASCDPGGFTFQREELFEHGRGLSQAMHEVESVQWCWNVGLLFLGMRTDSKSRAAWAEPIKPGEACTNRFFRGSGSCFLQK